MSKKYKLHELPQAYFSDNNNAKELRRQLIRNQALIAEEFQTSLEEVFFSEENIDLINKQLILSVWEKSNKEYRIKPQTTESLIIVMRYVFIEDAKHLPYDIGGQIRELNCRVVGEILPKVFSNIEQRIGYLRDIEKFPEPPPLPVNPKSLNKSLPSVTRFFEDIYKK